MAHQQQMDFCRSVKEMFPGFFRSRLVLDVGSLDINGNNQYLFDGCQYFGVDLCSGKNVDFSSKGHEFMLPDESVDVVISTECFEHDCFYDLTLRNIVRMLKPGGLFLFSCATTGRPEHGTRRTTPADAPFVQGLGDWGDYYKNLEESDIRAVLDVDEIFQRYGFSVNDQTFDLYFWGIKEGVLEDRGDYSFLLRRDEALAQVAVLQGDLVERDAEISRLRIEEGVAKGFLEELRSRLKEQECEISRISQELEGAQSAVANLEWRLSASDSLNAELQRRISGKDQQVAEIISSRSWRVTKPLRLAGQLVRGDWGVKMGPLMQENLKGASVTIRRARNAMRYVARGDLAGLRDRIRARRRDAAITSVETAACIPNQKIWGVLTPPHTLHLANLISERIMAHGWRVEVMTEAPENFDCDWYIVLCPQIFKRLPPGEKRISYQLEQSISSRWFTAQYVETLENSLAVLEYSLVNVDFLHEKGISYPHVHYLPIGTSRSALRDVAEQKKSFDVLFYGDSNSSARRTKMLEALRQHFDVRVVNELFGGRMQDLMRQARVVINLHYYENALLEMPRIQECLSLGVPVVSESAQDQGDYPELQGVVRFFEEGSIPAMLAAVRLALDNPVTSEQMYSAVERGGMRFDFMFDRFLVAMGFLPSSHVKNMQIPVPPKADRVALSLPETIGRRKVFEASKPDACFVFDGIRRRPGWIGCGLSYQALAKYALASGRSSLTVMEDDVILPSDFEEKMSVVREYLDGRSNKWDVFAGVIASLHSDCNVLSVEVFKDFTFVTIDKMTSTVFNIYSQEFLRLMLSWDPENLDATSNTIDRFIERQRDLRVVVMLPFFVGHREEVHSTLWGFQNTQYRDMIAESQAALYSKVLSFQDAMRPSAVH